jgi:predicted nucleic acid-binding protein
MEALVRDASVALSCCFPGDPTEDTPYSQRILQKLATRDAIVPDIWAFEVANGVFVSHTKRKRVTERQIADYLKLLQALPIRVDSQDLWANVNLESLARRRNLAAYDAAYLDLALRTGLPIATADRPLRQAAIEEGIEVLE